MTKKEKCKKYAARGSLEKNRARRIAKHDRLGLGDKGWRSKLARVAKTPRGTARRLQRERAHARRGLAIVLTELSIAA